MVVSIEIEFDSLIAARANAITKIGGHLGNRPAPPRQNDFASGIYNRPPGAHDADTCGETTMPQAGQPQEIKIMAAKSKAKKSAPKKKTAAKKKK
jgi:hypothetical protein